MNRESIQAFVNFPAAGGRLVTTSLGISLRRLHEASDHLLELLQAKLCFGILGSTVPSRCDSLITAGITIVA